MPELEGGSSTARLRLCSSGDEREQQQLKKKQKIFVEEEREGSSGITEEVEGSRSISEDEEEEEEFASVEAVPVGDAVKVTGTGNGEVTHYKSFVFDSEEYTLEDSVLLAPAEGLKPYVAIIKDIYQYTGGSLEVLGQWFYRPEEAKKKGGGYWQSRDVRELFYSFHYDTFPAESVMHKCIVHYLPLHKQPPKCKLHPGFVVQKVYDTVNKKIWNLSDSDYEDDKQEEIELLVQKTLHRLGDLPDVKTQEPVTEQEEHIKNRRLLRKKNISTVNVSRSKPITGADEYLRETPAESFSSNASEYHAILENYAALTGDHHRDKWMEKLLEAVQQACEHGVLKEDSGDGADEVIKNNMECKDMNTANRSEKEVKYVPFQWPDFAVRAVYALEKVSHDHYPEFQKYNQKMRSLVFNLQKNPILAFRLLDEELEPSKILQMSPNELKEAFTIEETARGEPDDEPKCMQMTVSPCLRCNELKVGIRDIIKAGRRDRYQLECMLCGHSWYASRDEISTMTVEPTSARAANTTPLPTSKSKVEKNPASRL